MHISQGEIYYNAKYLWKLKFKDQQNWNPALFAIKLHYQNPPIHNPKLYKIQKAKASNFLTSLESARSFLIPKSKWGYQQ
jgi:hypothetical protein